MKISFNVFTEPLCHPMANPWFHFPVSFSIPECCRLIISWGEKVVLVGDTGAARDPSDFLSWSQERVQEAEVGPGRQFSQVLIGEPQNAPCSCQALA